MPICRLLTNVPASAVPEDFEVKLCHLMAEVLSKPIERVSVAVEPGRRMAKAGTTSPTCTLQVWSIAVFDAERNPQYAAKLYPFIADTLGIAEDRIIVLFHDIQRHELATPQ